MLWWGQWNKLSFHVECFDCNHCGMTLKGSFFSDSPQLHRYCEVGCLPCGRLLDSD